jgi:hypothetical protein
MSRAFEFRPQRLILAVALILVGFASVYLFESRGLRIAGKNFTSIGILLSGLVFYSGILVIVAMFKDEKILSVAMLLPSIVAVGIFVYGFIGWSLRVSLSQWKGLTPDFTWVGLKQYSELILNDPRFLIDIRNTAVFTVGFITICLLLGLMLRSCSIKN